MLYFPHGRASFNSAPISKQKSLNLSSGIISNSVACFRQSLTYGDGLQEIQEVRVGVGCTGLFCDNDGDSFFTMTEVMSTVVMDNSTADSSNETEDTSTATVSTATVDDCANGNCTDNTTEGSASGFLGYFRLSYNGDSTGESKHMQNFSNESYIYFCL